MICYACKRDRPPEDFAIDRSKPSRRKSICKTCDSEKALRYYRTHGSNRPPAPPRRCTECGDLAVSQRHHYCAVHGAAAHERRARRKYERRRAHAKEAR